MKKYLHYLRRILRLSVLELLMYPQDLWWALFTVPIKAAVSIGYVYIVVLITKNGTVGDMASAELIFTGSWSTIVWYLISFTPLNSGMISMQIERGSIDKFILQPFPLLFLTIFQKIYIQKIVEITLHLSICGTILLWGLIVLSPLQMIQGLFVIVSCFLLIISISIAAESMDFFLPKNIFAQFFIQQSSSIAKYPKDIYPSLFQTLFTLFMPAFLITNPLFEVFKGTYSWPFALLTLCMILFWAGLGMLLWRKGVQYYHSAN